MNETTIESPLSAPIGDLLLEFELKVPVWGLTVSTLDGYIIAHRIFHDKMKTEIEIWDNTEESKCVHSFWVEDDEVQKLSIRKQKNPRSSVFIDVYRDKIKVIDMDKTTEHKL